jgi:hypothetical protein
MGATSTVWVAPSGVSSGIDDAVLVLNTTPVEGIVTVSQIGPAGEVAITGLESVVLPASGLISIAVPAGIPNGEIVVRATVPVVVQRMLLRGHDLSGRSAVLGLPTVPSPEAGS